MEQGKHLHLKPHKEQEVEQVHPNQHKVLEMEELLPRLQCLQQHLHPRQGGPQEMEVEPLALVEALPQQQIGVGEMASGKEHRAGSANGHGRF